jgi:hypothetical protein
MNYVATIFRISNINNGRRHKHRRRIGHKASVEEAKSLFQNRTPHASGFGIGSNEQAWLGRFPQRRIINYIARRRRWSSASGASRVT